MNKWMPLLHKLVPGAHVIVQHVQGGRYDDRVMSGAPPRPDYICLSSGTYSLRNGWHVLGERRIIEVVDDTPKPVHIPDAREKLIAQLVRKHPQVHV